jgi:hypothetical protein
MARLRTATRHEDTASARQADISRQTGVSRCAVQALLEKHKETGNVEDRRLAAKEPYLRRGNKGKRLNYARKHRNWGAEKWQQLLWTVESKCEIFSCSRKHLVCQRAGERYTNQCLQATVKHGGGSTVKHGGGSLQVWECISANGVGDLVRINGLLNGEKYRQILIHHAIPSGLAYRECH